MTIFLAIVALVIAIAIGGTWWYSQAPSDAYHSVCSASSCIVVPGEGVSACASDNDCEASSSTVTTLITPTTVALDPCTQEISAALAKEDVAACRTTVTSCLTALVYCEAAADDADCLRWYQNENVPALKQELCPANIAYRAKDAEACSLVTGTKKTICEAIHAKSTAQCATLQDAQDRAHCRNLVATFALDASLCDEGKSNEQCTLLVSFLKSVSS